MSSKLTGLVNAAAGFSSPLAPETLGNALGQVGSKVGEAVEQRIRPPHGDFVNKTGKAKEANASIVTDEETKTRNVLFDRFANQYKGDVTIKSFEVTKEERNYDGTIKQHEKATMVIRVETKVPGKDGQMETVVREFEITIRGKKVIKDVLGKDRSPEGQKIFADEYAKFCLVGSDVMHERAAFDTDWTVDMRDATSAPTFKQKGLLFTSNKDELAGRKILTEHSEKSGKSYFLGNDKGDLLSFADYHKLIMQRIVKEQTGKDDVKGKAPDSVELEEDDKYESEKDPKKQKPDELTSITNQGAVKLPEPKQQAALTLRRGSVSSTATNTAQAAPKATTQQPVTTQPTQPAQTQATTGHSNISSTTIPPSVAQRLKNIDKLAKDLQTETDIKSFDPQKLNSLFKSNESFIAFIKEKQKYAHTTATSAVVDEATKIGIAEEVERTLGDYAKKLEQVKTVSTAAQAQAASATSAPAALAHATTSISPKDAKKIEQAKVLLGEIEDAYGKLEKAVTEAGGYPKITLAFALGRARSIIRTELNDPTKLSANIKELEGIKSKMSKELKALKKSPT